MSFITLFHRNISSKGLCEELLHFKWEFLKTLHACLLILVCYQMKIDIAVTTS